MTSALEGGVVEKFEIFMDVIDGHKSPKNISKVCPQTAKKTQLLEPKTLTLTRRFQSLDIWDNGLGQI